MTPCSEIDEARLELRGVEVHPRLLGVGRTWSRGTIKPPAPGVGRAYGTSGTPSVQGIRRRGRDPT